MSNEKEDLELADRQYCPECLSEYEYTEGNNSCPICSEKKDNELLELTSYEEKAKSILAYHSTLNPMDFTDEQRATLLYIQDNYTSGEILINGFAGTGKTTIVENIIRHFQKNKAICILAPTNKACMVLRQKLLKAGNADVSTIHSFLYGEPNLDGTWQIKEIKNAKNLLLIVDEASMISKELHDDLLKASPNAMIIYLGDSFQLEQIGEQSNIWNLKKLNLTEVKRNDGDILNLATYIRTKQKNVYPINNSKDITILKKVTDAYSLYVESILNKEDSVFIVATNDSRNSINELVRSRICDNFNFLNIGERLISVSNSLNYCNGEVFSCYSLEYIKKYKITLRDKYKTNEYLLYICKINNQKAILIPNLDKASFHTFELNSLYDSELMSIFDYTEDDEPEDSFLEFNKYKRKMVVKKSIIVCTYGYAISAHKSQGSQFDKVFVYQNYSAPSWNSARWFYTAITRAVSKLVIIPNSKYQLGIEL